MKEKVGFDIRALLFSGTKHQFIYYRRIRMISKKEREEVLDGQYFNWMQYATNEEGLTHAQAQVEYYNRHRKGLYLICESPYDGSTKLYIKDVTNAWWDNEEEPDCNWFKIFTFTNEPTKKGYSICKVDHYRLDSHGYINLKVTSLKPLDNYRIYSPFVPVFEGSFRSMAWWYLFNQTNRFFPVYHFPAEYNRSPNLGNMGRLVSDVFYGAPQVTIANEILRRFIAGEIEYEDIEREITELSPWDKFLEEVVTAVRTKTVDQRFGLYPEFAKKLSMHFDEVPEIKFRSQVIDYVCRQNEYYWSLVEEKVEGFSMDSVLTIPERIEKGLEYRKHLKELEKEDRKRKRKEKKAVVTE
jgi:hypothetical protein